MYLAELLIEAGQSAEARGLLKRSAELLRAAGDRELLAIRQSIAATFDAARGEEQRSSDRMERAQELLSSIERPGQRLLIDCRRARARLLLGNSARARAIMQRVQGALVSAGCPPGSPPAAACDLLSQHPEMDVQQEIDALGQTVTHPGG
jgi:ATP/maltotriose-dependent transcriptional regulator MalT